MKELLERTRSLKELALSKGLSIAPRLDVALFFMKRALSIMSGLPIDEGEPIKSVQGEIMDVEVEEDLLALNRKIALENKALLDRHGVKAIDFMGSLGAGKTSIIEALVEALKDRYRIAVIVGDVATSIDANRISRHGIRAIQINTGRECHLDAQLIRRALQLLDLKNIDLLFIENVGNLICPADFPLGAHMRVVVVSVSEGSDMIIKHPTSFVGADVVVINKIDVTEAFNVDLGKLVNDLKEINPKAKVVLMSARKRAGLDDLIRALGLIK
ncbi:MAG: hydrogenase nickel incorporation protein HypB [Candidatus Verstraetearchaeota archaeon]|nr:hydrogenase nickel incorporation protein HypB [Candidatus Verstraetearchaeota archaeon]